MSSVHQTKNKQEKQPYVLSILPGFILSFIIIMAGIYGAELLGKLLIQMNVLPEGSSSPISGIFVAIILGMIIRNTLPIPSLFMPGIGFAVKYALRAGIILLGLRLSLVEAVKLGAWGIPLIVICITVGLSVTLYFTKKLQQSSRLGTLIACGTGICGVTAIMATSPVIKAKDNEISYAVANITIFGLIGMLLYPYIANTLFGDDPIKAGLFLGTAIHDTAQVTGAALIHDQIFQLDKVIDVATVTKLTRNLFIIAVIPLVSFLFFRKQSETEGEAQVIPKWYTFIPLFVIGFLAFALLRTIGDVTASSNGTAFGLLSIETWETFYTRLSGFGSTYMLGIAMAGVGLSTNFKMFKGLGLKPFYIGMIAAISIGVVSATLVGLFGHLIVL